MVLGVVLCIMGVAVVIGADFRELFQGRAVGYLLAFGAVLSWNAYNFITAAVHEHYSSVSMAFNQLCCTVIIIMPYAIHTMPLWRCLHHRWRENNISGAGSAGMGYMILVRGLNVLGPTISAMFSNSCL